MFHPKHADIRLMVLADIQGRNIRLVLEVKMKYGNSRPKKKRMNNDNFSFLVFIFTRETTIFFFAFYIG